MKKIFLILSLLLSFLLFSCEEERGEITGIAISPYSVKQVYDVDEVLDLTGAKIAVTYQNGEVEKLDCKEEWVHGFDTVTTGEKELTVLYNGFQTAPYPYTVCLKNYPDKEVKTSTRLDMFEQEQTDYTEYTFSVIHCDIDIYALSFVVETKGKTLSEELAEVVVIPEYGIFQYAVKRKTETSFAVLLYCTDIYVKNCLFLNIQLNGTPPEEIILSEIVLSDKKDDYYLPDVTNR